MHTVNIHEAKTHLSRLIKEALEGKPFIIAKAGKPLVKVDGTDVVIVGRCLRSMTNNLGKFFLHVSIQALPRMPGLNE